MKNQFKYFGITWAVLFVIYNVIAFVIPANITHNLCFYMPTYWIGYVFITLCLIAQLACSWYFSKADTNEKLFLNIPVLRIGYSMLIAAAVVGTVFMVIAPWVPAYIGAVICVILLGVYIISANKAVSAVEMVSKVGENVKAATQFIKGMTVDAENLVLRAKTDNARVALKNVYETFRYSDPMSSDALAGIEAEITVAFGSLREAVAGGDDDTVKASADNLVLLIKERNNKCRALK